MRRAPKPARAARSASETALRSNAVSAISNKPVFTTLSRRKTVSVQQLNKRDRASKTGNTPKKVRSSRAKTSRKPDDDIIDAEIVSVTPASGRQFTGGQPSRSPKGAVTAGPRAITAGSSKPSPKSKAPKKTKKEKTPGMQTVFKATPAVDLNEGPNFGKTTSIIEKTQQPKAPRKQRNA